METYRSVWLVEDGCAIAALTLGAAFRFRDYLERIQSFFERPQFNVRFGSNSAV
jgi:hypothetical protein